MAVSLFYTSNSILVLYGYTTQLHNYTLQSTQYTYVLVGTRNQKHLHLLLTYRQGDQLKMTECRVLFSGTQKSKNDNYCNDISMISLISASLPRDMVTNSSVVVEDLSSLHVSKLAKEHDKIVLSENEILQRYKERREGNVEDRLRD